MPAPAMHLSTGLGRPTVAKAAPSGAPPGASGLPMPRGVGSAGGEAVVFQGEITGTARELILYSSAHEAKLPAAITLTGIVLRPLPVIESASAITPNTPDVAQQVDRDVLIQLFIGDLATPRAHIRLQDLLRYGARPLNLYRAADEPIQLQLVDPAGWLQAHPLRFALVLQW